MRVCIITHLRHYEKGGAYYVGGAFVKFLGIVRSLFDEVEVCVPVFDHPPAHFVRVDVPNVTVVPLPRYFEKWEVAALAHPLKLARRLWPVVGRSGVAMVTGTVKSALRTGAKELADGVAKAVKGLLEAHMKRPEE